ncbi:MAG: hypothetical protein H7832_05255 [Magnetococcus sp. DMHC-6]
MRGWIVRGGGGPDCGDVIARNVLLVPIKSVVGQKVVGVMLVMNTLGRSYFEEKDRVLLERVALHLQLAVENVSLRQEMMDFSEILSTRALKMGWLAKTGFILLLALFLISLGVNIYHFSPPFIEILKMLP